MSGSLEGTYSLDDPHVALEVAARVLAYEIEADARTRWRRFNGSYGDLERAWENCPARPEKRLAVLVQNIIGGMFSHRNQAWDAQLNFDSKGRPTQLILTDGRRMSIIRVVLRDRVIKIGERAVDMLQWDGGKRVLALLACECAAFFGSEATAPATL